MLLLNFSIYYCKFIIIKKTNLSHDPISIFVLLSKIYKILGCYELASTYDIL